MFSANRVKPTGDGGAGSSPFTITGGAGGPSSGASGSKAAIPSHRLSKRVKSIKRFFSRPAGEQGLELLRDRDETTTEIWVTFLIVIIIGGFFLGGGIYLVWLGSEDNVVDFVVVGGMGAIIGTISILTGTVLFCKPLCQAHQKRKEERVQTKEVMRRESEYINRAKARIMTLQVADSLGHRRPSNAELYGLEDGDATKGSQKPDSRIQSASSAATTYDPPPPLALPSEHKSNAIPDKSESPVIYREITESTMGDLVAIASAADKKKLNLRVILMGPDEIASDIDNSASSTDPVSDQNKDTRTTTDHEKRDGSNAVNITSSEGADQQQPQHLGSSDDLLADLGESETEMNNEYEYSTDSHQSPSPQRPQRISTDPLANLEDPGDIDVPLHVTHTQSVTMTTVSVEDSDEEEETKQTKIRTLSAVNSRRSTLAETNNDKDDDEEESIEVITQ